MTTEEIMACALELAGLSEVPEDSGVSVPGKDIRRAIIGIDMETPELLLARQLGMDAVISHHPVTGPPYINLHHVMTRQIERMELAGVPTARAERALGKRKDMVDVSRQAGNYERTRRAAELLGMPFMNIHLPADIVTEKTVEGQLASRLASNHRPRVSDVLSVLLDVPEYSKAASKPRVRCGSPDNLAGRVVVAMAGGTSGGIDVANAYFEAGVGTLVVMHFPEDDLRRLRESDPGNLIVAGHMASDSVGLNVLIRALEGQGLELVRAGGIISP